MVRTSAAGSKHPSSKPDLIGPIALHAAMRWPYQAAASVFGT
jgi:hypothetical protein